MFWVPARMAAASKNQFRCPKRFIYHSKENYISVKRDLYVNGLKRGLCGYLLELPQRLKRPIHMSKKTYIHVKRDLCGTQKRLIYV